MLFSSVIYKIWKNLSYVDSIYCEINIVEYNIGSNAIMKMMWAYITDMYVYDILIFKVGTIVSLELILEDILK